MAEIHGKSTLVFIGGINVTGLLNKVTKSSETDLPDATVFGLNSKKYAPGIVDGKVKAEGLFDNDGTGLVLDRADDIFSAALGTGPKNWTAVWGSDALGSRCRMAYCIENNYEISADIGDLVQVSAEGTPSVGGVLSGLVLQPFAAQTASGNTASFDYGATPESPPGQGLRGGVGFLQVGDVGNGCTLVVKVQHSTNNSTWVDLCTFANVVGTASAIAERGSQRVETALPTTQVERYVRALWTMTGGTLTATFRCDFARNIT